jgi:hypothetical protein
MLSNMLKDTVTLIKKDGTQFDGIKASVQTKKIFINDASLPIEEGDNITRILPSGLTEVYLVLDRGFYDKQMGSSAHYQVQVSKVTTRELQQLPMQFNIGSVYGSNIATQGNATITNTFNFSALDQEIEERGGSDKEELRKMIYEIKELFEDSEKVKKGSLSKFSEIMQKHSWITGGISKMGLDFLIGNLK